LGGGHLVHDSMILGTKSVGTILHLLVALVGIVMNTIETSERSFHLSLHKDNLESVDC
jgi:hypothetical protein